MTKQRSCLIVAAMVFLLTAADHLLFISPATGFVSAGSVFWRYGLWAAALLFLFIATRSVPDGNAALFEKKGLGAGTLAGKFFLAGGIFALLGMTAADFVLAAGLLAGAFFFYLADRGKPNFTLGCILTVTMLYCCLLRYLQRPASNRNLPASCGLLCCIVGVLFAVSLLREMFTPAGRSHRMLAFWGSAAFLFCGGLTVAKYLMCFAASDYTFCTLPYDLALLGLAVAGLHAFRRSF